MTDKNPQASSEQQSPTYVSAKQLAIIWGVKTPTILRWTHTKPRFAQHAVLLPSGEWRYHMEEIENYFRSLSTESDIGT